MGPALSQQVDMHLGTLTTQTEHRKFSRKMIYSGACKTINFLKIIVHDTETANCTQQKV